MSHSLLYDMSTRPDSVSNFSHGFARAEHLRTWRQLRRHAYQQSQGRLQTAQIGTYRSVGCPVRPER